jgi:DNA (cytosine-5)-methyltransferase 1
MDVINHLSLCAGVGGIDIGLRKVVKGLRTLAMVEREAFSISVLESKMEEGALDKCPIYPDLLRFPWERYRGLLDIVSGGFPCQPFSISGSRKSTEDPRHLWPFIKEGIGITKPRFCFFENVDGIASAKSPGYYSVLHHVLSDLEEMGYRTEAGCFSAEEVGAPHLRKRWFILAYSGCNDETSRGKRKTPPEGSREGNGEGGSGCDARTRHLEAARKATGMAYGERERLEGHTRHERYESGPTRKSESGGPTSESGLQRWPARPGEKQKGWEPPRTVKPGLGRYVDGIPNRVDRLRALGNAVVPEVAATAFVHLLKRLEE